MQGTSSVDLDAASVMASQRMMSEAEVGKPAEAAQL